MNSIEQKFIDIYNEYKEMSDDDSNYSMNISAILNIAKPEDIEDGCIHSLTLEFSVLYQSLISTDNDEVESLILEVLDTGEEIVKKYNHEEDGFWNTHDRNMLIDQCVIEKIDRWKDFCKNNGIDNICWFIEDCKVDDVWIYNDAIWLENWFEEFSVML
jgi:hypothetical protein